MTIELTSKIESALKKYPKAKRRAVENVAISYRTPISISDNMNLEMDAKLYNWNAHTMSAIRFILK